MKHSRNIAVPKTNMTIEKQPCEDVSPIKDYDVQLSYVTRWWFQKNICAPLFGEDFQFDVHIFQMGGSTTNQVSLKGGYTILSKSSTLL